MMWKRCELYEAVVKNGEVIDSKKTGEGWFSLQEADALEAKGLRVCVADYKFQKDRPE